jgi:P27 family predicted phage terminase small subunit
VGGVKPDLIFAMGNRGPQAQPAVLKALNGNPGKRAIDLEGGIHPLVEIPECPSYIGEAGKREWKRITELLLPLGLISGLNKQTLGIYCHACDRLFYAAGKIRSLNKKKPGAGFTQLSPNGYEQLSHWYIMENKAMDQVARYGASFGLTPADLKSVAASANQGSLPTTPTLPGVPELPQKPTLASFNPHITK